MLTHQMAGVFSQFYTVKHTNIFQIIYGKLQKISLSSRNFGRINVINFHSSICFIHMEPKYVWNVHITSGHYSNQSHHLTNNISITQWPGELSVCSLSSCKFEPMINNRRCYSTILQYHHISVLQKHLYHGMATEMCNIILLYFYTNQHILLDQ